MTLLLLLQSIIFKPNYIVPQLGLDCGIYVIHYAKLLLTDTGGITPSLQHSKRMEISKELQSGFRLVKTTIDDLRKSLEIPTVKYGDVPIFVVQNTPPRGFSSTTYSIFENLYQNNFQDNLLEMFDGKKLHQTKA